MVDRPNETELQQFELDELEHVAITPYPRMEISLTPWSSKGMALPMGTSLTWHSAAGIDMLARILRNNRCKLIVWSLSTIQKIPDEPRGVQADTQK